MVTHKSTASNSAFTECFSATGHLFLIFKSSYHLLFFCTEKSNLTSIGYIVFVKFLPYYNLTGDLDSAFAEFIHVPKVIE
jgi:hypothetical protein